MDGHRQYKITDYRFGLLIVALREKVGNTQKEIGDALEVSRRTIQHWEAGTAFPDTNHLKKLIAYYLDKDSFTKGREHDEVLALWSQADESAARRKTMFDENWFEGLLQQKAVQTRPTHGTPLSLDEPAVSAPRIDWGGAPDVVQVIGREREINDLKQWVIDEQCRLVVVIGMGGIGKTTLAVKFAQDAANQFEYVIWRSLRNAPAFQSLLVECFQILSPVQSPKPSIQLLMELLQRHRCLLILDNVETLHRAGNLSGIYREGFEEYQRLFQSVAETRHKSCLILTSRERPVDLDVIEGRQSPVRVLKISGLTSTASQTLLTDKGLFGTSGAWDVFVHYYTGNPLALKIASGTVRDLFGGDLAAFLREAPVTLHTLNQLLGNQFEHLSALERDILFWLAIEREPVNLNNLRRDFLLEIPNNQILSGLLSLLQRSLIERSDQDAVFSLLPVLLEFVTDRLVSTVGEQIIKRSIETITKYTLVKSQSIDQIRESQVRMIVHPVLSILRRHFGSQSVLADHLTEMVDAVRKLPREAQGYAGGNLVNLLVHLNMNIRNKDFSELVLRQIYLQGIEAQDVNFAGVEFVDSRFTEPLETIGAMTMSSNGTYMAASTYNGQIRVWNVADGKPLWTATNASRAWSLAFSPDETQLACSHFRGQVSLWDVATGRLVHIFEGHQAWVHTVAFDPSGQFLASAGIDTQVCIWNLKERKLSQVIQGHIARVWSLAYSSDSKLLASSGEEDNARIWDLTTGNLLHLLAHKAGGIIRLAFHPNGTWLATGCDEDSIITIWNARTGEKLVVLNSHSSSPTTSLAFNSNGSLLAIGGRDGSIELWQVAGEGRYQYTKMLMGHHHYINVIAFSQHNLLATLSHGEDIRLWNVNSGKLLRVIEGFNRMIGANVFSPDGKLLLMGDTGGKIRVWDVLHHCYIAKIQGHTGPIWIIEFSPDGHTFATAGDDQTIKLWDVDSFECVKMYSSHAGTIWSLAYNRDGSLLASGGSPHGILLWDPAVGAGTLPLNHLETQDDIWSLAFDSSGATLVSGHSSGAIIVWDVRTGARKTTLQHGTVPVGALRFNGNGDVLMSSSNEYVLKYWDLSSGACKQAIPADLEGNRTRAVAIGSDGSLVATGSGSLKVFLWRDSSLNSQPEPLVIEGHPSRIWGIALSPDEHYLASSDQEGTTLLVDTHSGQIIERIQIDRPYERMNIRGVTGLNAAERAALKSLGAVETAPPSQD